MRNSGKSAHLDTKGSRLKEIEIYDPIPEIAQTWIWEALIFFVKGLLCPPKNTNQQIIQVKQKSFIKGGEVFFRIKKQTIHTFSVGAVSEGKK